MKPITDKLGVREVVDKYVPMERESGLSHGEVMEALIFNRLSSPRPLYKVEDWARSYGLEDIYGIDAEKLNDDRVGRALDAIFPCLEELKNEIAMHAISEFAIGKDRIVYDLTSLYFEGEYEDSELITFGYSSSGDGDKKQVNVGFNIGGEGVPLYHNVIKGNVADKVTVMGNMEGLRRALKTSEFLTIGDRGMMTRKNMARMQDKGLSYLGSFQLGVKEKAMIKAIEEEEFEPLEYKSRKGGSYYGVEKVISFGYKGREYTTRAIVVKSEEKAEKDAERRGKNIEKLSEGLEGIKAKLNTRKYKRAEYVRGRIDKLFTGKRRYKRLFDIRLDGEDGELSLSYALIEEAIADEAKLDGKYIIVTDKSRDEMPMDEVLETYKSRNVVEVRIRNFKSTLRVRPLFLQSDERIASLVFVNVLALMVYSILEVLARRRGMTAMTARRLLEGFEFLAMVTIYFEDGEVSMVEELSPWQREVIERLGFPMPSSMLASAHVQ